MRVLTIGTFDLLHCGHIRLFRRAAQLGELHVGVNSDRFVKTYKGVSPREAFDIRCGRVAAVSSVHEVHANDGPGVDLIRALMPEMVAVGSDWLERSYPNQIGTSVDELVALDVAVIFLPRTPGISSTQLRQLRSVA